VHIPPASINVLFTVKIMHSKEDDRPDPNANYREGEEEDYLDELDREEDQAEPDLETDPEDAADSEK